MQRNPGTHFPAACPGGDSGVASVHLLHERPVVSRFPRTGFVQAYLVERSCSGWPLGLAACGCRGDVEPSANFVGVRVVAPLGPGFDSFTILRADG